jgi:ubiquinone/menaquinone biosynthesis C-methylase UbiE
VPAVGFYREQVVPRLVGRLCGAARFDRWRALATDGLHGRVVEIGFGSGLNVPHYPPDLEVVFAVEPSAVALRQAEPRIAASPVPVSHIGLDGQDIPLLDASCDAALVTFALCTVPDAQQALSEVRRVLRPGGTVHFVEHGLSPEPGLAKWQHRIEPLRCRPAGGCHLTRDPTMLVGQAGFVMQQLEKGSAGGPKLSSWLTFGVASAPVV